MKYLLRIAYYLYYVFIGFPLFFLETAIICFLVVASCSLGYGSWGTRNLGRIWAKLSLWLHLCPIEVVGEEHIPDSDEPCVVVANHQSAFDIFALYGYINLPFKWVMKEELRKVPFVGWACEASGFIFVDSKRPSSINQTMTSAKEVLSNGDSIFIFPEGSRTLTGKMTRFKKGAFVMANELDVPILPVSIDGAYDVLQRGKYLAYPHKIKLTIHPKVNISHYGDESPANIIETSKATHKQIASVLPREQK